MSFLVRAPALPAPSCFPVLGEASEGATEAPSEALALSLFVARVLADDPRHALSLDHLAMLAPCLHRGSDFHRLSYLNRYVMRPRVRSYGDSSTFTRSPGRIRMKFIRILPLTWASTRWPLSSSTRNIAFGSGSTTVPSTSIASSLGMPLPAAALATRPGRSGPSGS